MIFLNLFFMKHKNLDTKLACLQRQMHRRVLCIHQLGGGGGGIIMTMMVRKDRDLSTSQLFTSVSVITISVLFSIKNGIYAIGKARMRSIPSLRSAPNIAF